MNRPTVDDGHMVMPEAEFEQLRELAAERGALKALEDVDLDGEAAAVDIRDLSSLLQSLRLAKRTAVQKADGHNIAPLEAWKTNDNTVSPPSGLGHPPPRSPKKPVRAMPRAGLSSRPRRDSIAALDSPNDRRKLGAQVTVKNAEAGGARGQQVDRFPASPAGDHHAGRGLGGGNGVSWLLRWGHHHLWHRGP
ncbi:DUF6127 family protein [Roseospirillum parvum]|uniref:DUF6127 family protein n=1 Tax=Roseospirillum parvum TaxID=83401 RepID=UPI001FDF8594|nr:DUF6127 family protein [Roseospirillum parvum]